MGKFTDLVALDDFSEGAMENWGMITFRDSALLYTDATTSVQNKEHIALVICHEVAHQWFGNLVTMDWWNDLWLNEGFANYMEFRCVDRLFPDWNIMTRFYAENVALSHELDGLRSSRAISSHIFNQTNIMGLFDAISYHKASAIIRMLQSLTGERNFQRSLIQYLNKYAYGNAKGSHLWEIVEKHAVLPHGISIQSLANAYIKQVGCPEIFVTLSDMEIVVHSQAISVIDRTMILVDAFDFSKSSKLNIEVYLNLLLYATEEMDHLAWMMINKQMKYIETLIEETPFAHIFKDLQRTLILRPYERVGWSTNTSMTPAQKGLQAEVIGTACRLRNRDCVKQAQHRYNEWVINKKRPSPELLGVILNEGVSQGGRAAWDRAYTAYQEAKSPTEKNQLISAMASTTQSTLISRLLRLCLDGSSFRPNTIPRVLSELSKTSVTRALAWRFFRVNYKNFVKMFGDGSNLLVSSLRAMIDKLSTQEDLEEVKAFLSDKRLEHNNHRLNQMFDQIELNIQWRRLNEEPLLRWLHDWDEKRRVNLRGSLGFKCPFRANFEHVMTIRCNVKCTTGGDIAEFSHSPFAFYYSLFIAPCRLSFYMDNTVDKSPNHDLHIHYVNHDMEIAQHQLSDSEIEYEVRKDDPYQISIRLSEVELRISQYKVTISLIMNKINELGVGMDSDSAIHTSLASEVEDSPWSGAANMEE
ncbi:unnamed protein product [Angiostrongylus costaricensis]|uniref:Aminopeptidase N n=1 Tax=Angiostrongylus costaricensis TaxID=334426 RepID=A0A0R3PLH8_ANGCS|nr:unnamed protein product [Angiostrongylus costaricensis]